MNATDCPIITVSPSDERRAVDVIVRAFREDPSVRWVYPDLDQYLATFPEFVRAFGGKAVEHGTAYAVDGFRGAALWLAPGVHPDEGALMALLRRTVPARAQKAVLSLFEQMGSFHPEEPHWYLPLIGVEPAYHRKGYGAALMKHALAVCDREKRPAYLESSNPENISLYRRHGFEVIGTIRIGAAPPVCPMLRRPRS